jgi:hypothetical protein
MYYLPVRKYFYGRLFNDSSCIDNLMWRQLPGSRVQKQTNMLIDSSRLEKIYCAGEVQEQFTDQWDCVALGDKLIDELERI